MHSARHVAFDDHTLCLMADSAVCAEILKVHITFGKKQSTTLNKNAMVQYNTLIVQEPINLN